MWCARACGFIRPGDEVSYSGIKFSLAIFLDCAAAFRQGLHWLRRPSFDEARLRKLPIGNDCLHFEQTLVEFIDLLD